MTNKKNDLNDFEKEVKKIMQTAKEIGEELSKEEAEQIVLNKIVHESKVLKFRKPILDAIEQNKKLLSKLENQINETLPLFSDDNQYVEIYNRQINESISKVKELISSLEELDFVLDDLVVELNN